MFKVGDIKLPWEYLAPCSGHRNFLVVFMEKLAVAEANFLPAAATRGRR